MKRLSIHLLMKGRRRIPLWVLALCLLAALPLPSEEGVPATSRSTLVPELGRVVSPLPAPPSQLRVVSFNVHKGRELERLIAGMEGNPALRTADLFLLQEVERQPAEERSQAAQLADRLELNYVYAPARPTEDGGTHGLAILSRFPLREVEVLELPYFDLNINTRRRIALAATVETGRGLLRVYNLHLDTRINTGDRLEQLRPVVEAARAHAIPATIVGGDFNTNPFLWLAHLFPIFRSSQAKAVDEFMTGNGFDTPLANVGPTLRRGLVRFRADSLYSRNLTVQDLGAETSVKASDHVPIWIDVAWPSPSGGED